MEVLKEFLSRSRCHFQHLKNHDQVENKTKSNTHVERFCQLSPRCRKRKDLYSSTPYTPFTNLAIAPKERRNVSNEIAMCYNGTLWRTYNINE